jgi:ParB/RepB/Spo0J family partition protein
MSQTSKYPLLQISPEDVDFNDENPRGETAEEIFNDETFEQLKDSVYKYGVLVPIVVHKQNVAGTKPYRLVDGERRLRAALATGVEEIPAHIASPQNVFDELLHAMHIHMLRKQWKPVAMTKVLKKIIKLHKENNQSISTKEQLNQLQALTGCSESRLKSLQRASKYSDKVLDDVDKGDVAFSHLVQFEESFVEPLQEKYPQIIKDIGRKKVREVLVNKAKNKILTGTRDLMDNIVPVIGKAKDIKEINYLGGLLTEFINAEDMPINDVVKKYNNKFPTSQEDIINACEEIFNSAENLSNMLDNIDLSEVKSLTSMKRKLERSLKYLRTCINKKLKTI